jgi:GT2 family glycosyltransferase
MSVVICTYNGASTIQECLEGLLAQDYPDYEIIVVSDGSTDGTGAIAREYGVHLIETENRGLSAARNTGMQAATGEIIAYIDDDAYPDPHWLRYLAASFNSTDYVALGGPNIPPPTDGPIASCVANAPGGPTHVLISDREAEHVPGCNLAVRKAALQAIGGFDSQFRVAGDDVDLCWRLQEAGGNLGFEPAAMVWHHRRNSVLAYWKQQVGYGKAEALLEQKWPEKYDAVGHYPWVGRIYGPGLTVALGLGRGRIYQGTWGSAPFQSIYQPAPGTLRSLSLMPEWYLIALGLAALSVLSILWSPLGVAIPLLLVSLVVPLSQAWLSAARVPFTGMTLSRPKRVKLRALLTFLYLIQPLARLWGRLRFGLTPWRQRGRCRLAVPQTRHGRVWSEEWRAPEQWLEDVEEALHNQGRAVKRGGNFDWWDLEFRGGLFCTLRTLMAVEEHGSGRQLLRFRTWPRFFLPGLVILLFTAFLSITAAADRAWLVALAFALALGLLVWRALMDYSTAWAAYQQALNQVEGEDRAPQ